MTVLPGKKFRLYENPDLRDCPSQLRLGMFYAGGEIKLTRTADRWLVAPGKGGLPLDPVPGLLSVKHLWEQEVLNIEYRNSNSQWVELADWEEWS